uniref:Uncharacterized protein n=1 Tax=Ditylenchus dipsaci TaxID=166011 RepID=A0A915DXQ3_9BILA
MNTELLLLLLFHLPALIPSVWAAQDMFCGQLKVHKQKWLSKSASTISSQKTVDLKECIGLCCSIAHCNAVTFIGFLADKRVNGAEDNIGSSSSPANCLLFNCGEDCGVVEQTVAREGVLTVLIALNNTNPEVPAAPTVPVS